MASGYSKYAGSPWKFISLSWELFLNYILGSGGNCSFRGFSLVFFFSLEMSTLLNVPVCQFHLSILSFSSWNIHFLRTHMIEVSELEPLFPLLKSVHVSSVLVKEFGLLESSVVFSFMFFYRVNSSGGSI